MVPSTITVIERLDRKSENGINFQIGIFKDLNFVLNTVKNIRYIQRYSKRFTEISKSKGSERRGRTVTYHNTYYILIFL